MDEGACPSLLRAPASVVSLCSCRDRREWLEEDVWIRSLLVLGVLRAFGSEWHYLVAAVVAGQIVVEAREKLDILEARGLERFLVGDRKGLFVPR
jgi:hypothetical protein